MRSVKNIDVEYLLIFLIGIFIVQQNCFIYIYDETARVLIFYTAIHPLNHLSGNIALPIYIDTVQK